MNSSHIYKLIGENDYYYSNGEKVKYLGGSFYLNGKFVTLKTPGLVDVGKSDKIKYKKSLTLDELHEIISLNKRKYTKSEIARYTNRSENEITYIFKKYYIY